MRQRQTITVVPLLMLALFLVGCPKGPAAMRVESPDTSGLVTAAWPPAPSEFVAAPELKDIHFDFDKYDIRPGDTKILDSNARWMKASPNMLVLVEGHADERGTNEYNLALGERRAKATMTYLMAHGVAAGRLTLISYGEERPLCAERHDGCWNKNRRGHFMVKPR